MNIHLLGSSGWRAALAFAVAITLSAASTALAAGAQVSNFDITTPIDEVDPADCFDGTMHVTGTERMTGQIVDLGEGNVRIHGSTTDTIDVAFSNGWTGAWTTSEHFALSTTDEHDVLTNVHRDTTSVYDSNGQFIGTVTFRVVEHFTLVDGIARVDFAHPKLTCDL